MGWREWAGNVEGHILLQTHNWPQSWGQNWLRQVYKLPVRQPCAFPQIVLYTESPSPPNETPLSAAFQDFLIPHLEGPYPYTTPLFCLKVTAPSASLTGPPESDPPPQEPEPFSASGNGTPVFLLGVEVGNHTGPGASLNWLWGSRGPEGP